MALRTLASLGDLSGKTVIVRCDLNVPLKDGEITDVLWGSPAFKAGLAPGAKLLAVNGLAADAPSVLSDAITAAATTTQPVVLLVRSGNRYREVPIDYHGGLRYPHLERIAGTQDRLDDILAPIK